MKNLFSNSNRFIYALLSLFIIVSACSDSTSSSEDEHEDAEGFRLKLSGQTIVEQLPDQDVTGSITVQAGQETALISIFFIDHDGEEFQPEDDDDSLGYTFSASGVAEFEQHAEDGKWSFHIHGEAAGTTNLTLRLMHDDHSDFDSQAITVTVTQAP